MSWDEKANCIDADPDIFFPLISSGSAAYAPAKKVCAGCEVRDECLIEALLTEQVKHRFGMRGGFTPKERDRMVALRHCVWCGNRFPSVSGRTTCSEPCRASNKYEIHERSRKGIAA